MPIRNTNSYVSFREKELPEIKDWKIGDTYNLNIEVKLTQKGKSRWDELEGGGERGEFEVTGVKAVGENSDIERLGSKYKRA